MALWLDLIPRLHKSDNLDERYHRLDNADNLTTFEAEGTRFSPVPEDTWTTPTDDFRSTVAQPATTVTMTTTTNAWRSTSGAGVMARRMSTPQGVRTSSAEDEGHEGKWRGDKTSPASRDQVLVQASSESTLSLSLTVGVGCFLLFLNVLIFAAMYYQKDRMKRERRLMKREMEHEQQMLAHIDSGCGGGGDGGGQVANTKILLNSDIYSNCDGTSTPLVPSIPPLPPAVFSKNHRPQQPQSLMFIHSTEATNQSRSYSQPVYANATSLCSPGWSQTIDANHSTMTNNADALHRLLTSPNVLDPDTTAAADSSLMHGNPSTVV